MTLDQRKEASARAVRNRRTRAIVADGMRAYGWDRAADAVLSMSPNKTSTLLLAAEDIRPGVMHELLAGRAPIGLHNMITEDTRDRRSAEGFALNAMKFDPHSIESVQGALISLDSDIAEDTDDPALRRRLQETIEVRERALAAGVFSHLPESMMSPEMAHARREFYMTTPPEKLTALTEAAQRITNQFYASHLAQARPVTRVRRPSEELKALESEHSRFATVEQFMADGAESKNLGNGVDVVRTGEDGYAVRVQGMVIPIYGDDRASDVLRRTPEVVDLGVDVPDSLMGQTLVSRAYLNPASARGAGHVAAMKRQIIANSLRAAVTPTSGSTGVTSGKPKWRTSSQASALGLDGTYEVAPPTEGKLLDSYLGERNATLRAADDHARRAVGIPQGVGAATTWKGRAKPTVRPYGGNAAERRAESLHGWSRMDRSAVGQVGSVAENFPVSRFQQAGPKVRDKAVWEDHAPAGVSERLRDQANDRDLQRIPPEVLVREANRIAKLGKNPDMAGTRAVTSKAMLDHVFSRRDLYAHYAPRASVAYHTAPEGVSGSDWLASMFPVDGVVNTSGYTVTSRPTLSAPPGAGPRTYRTRYLTADAVEISDANSIIGDRETFRVASIGEEDGIPTVYLVSENAAVDAAAR